MAVTDSNFKKIQQIETVIYGVTEIQLKLIFSKRTKGSKIEFESFKKGLLFLKYRPSMGLFGKLCGIEKVKKEQLISWLIELKECLQRLQDDFAWAKTLLFDLFDNSIEQYILREIKSIYPRLKEYENFINIFQVELHDEIKKIFIQPSLMKLTNSASTITTQLADTHFNKKYMFFGTNMDVKYVHKKSSKELEIKGNDLHEQLKKHEQILRYSLISQGNIIDKRNVAIATISFIVSRYPLIEKHAHTNEPESICISFNIVVPKEIWFVNTDKDEAEILKLKNYLKENASKYLQEPFIPSDKVTPTMDHHSEPALYRYLMGVKTVKDFVTCLAAKFPETQGKGHRVYAVILDIHSSNSMCKYCAPLSLAMENSNEGGFLKLLKIELENKDFAISKQKNSREKDIRMLIRYTYDQEFEKMSQQYIRQLNDTEDTELKDIKRLYQDRAILHAKAPAEMFFNPESVPKFAIFFSSINKPINTNLDTKADAKKETEEEITNFKLD